MKISCISLNSNLLSTKSQDKVVEFLKSKLYEIGEKVSSISYFENSLEQIKNQNIENYYLVFTKLLINVIV